MLDTRFLYQSLIHKFGRAKDIAVKRVNSVAAGLDFAHYRLSQKYGDAHSGIPGLVNSAQKRSILGTMADA
jgi:hypothetical protein